jgi:uncharacterized NAD-dependent epimerase/dehydratase family protein
LDQPDLKRYARIVLLTDGFSTPFLAKTAISMLRYRCQDVVAVLDAQQAGQTAQQLFGVGGDVPVVADLSEVDADALFVGIAPPGGQLPGAWRGIIVQGILRGCDIVSGLHDFLCRDEEFVQLARQHGRQLIDVRNNSEKEVASCPEFRRQCLRIHAVGHDCTIGKMSTCLEIQRGLLARGLDAGFAATGQTGIMIAGTGVPIDCVVADFVNGAAERLVLAHQQYDYLLIEGQGSISHPMYSSVTLGLLHGCAPDALVFCYDASRRFVKGLNGVPIPPNKQLVQTYETVANLRHPCKFIGAAANTRTLSEDQARADMERVEAELGIPVCDVYRDGPDRLVDAAIRLRDEVLAL